MTGQLLEFNQLAQLRRPLKLNWGPLGSLEGWFEREAHCKTLGGFARMLLATCLLPCRTAQLYRFVQSSSRALAIQFLPILRARRGICIYIYTCKSGQERSLDPRVLRCQRFVLCFQGHDVLVGMDDTDGRNQNPVRTTLKPWLTPWVLGVYWGILSFWAFLGGANLISSIHSIVAARCVTFVFKTAFGLDALVYSHVNGVLKMKWVSLEMREPGKWVFSYAASLIL